MKITIKKNCRSFCQFEHIPLPTCPCTDPKGMLSPDPTWKLSQVLYVSCFHRSTGIDPPPPSWIRPLCKESLQTIRFFMYEFQYILNVFEKSIL